jgi:Protein of unknown function (DUF3071)
MVELELVGLSEDGTQLVLADAAGEEFALPLDDRLRAVVRGDSGRPRQLETSMESALRPRDIQARIRAGESPDAVAEIAQVPVDRIMSYAVPVMAERGHIADRAQRSAVRRKNAEGPGRLLGDAVAESLRAAHVDPATCQWDAWRRGDGRWTVTAGYRADDGERTGTFVFDALSRYSVATDDDGRRLVGERVQDEQPQGRVRPSGRRLSAVASEYDAMLFDDDTAAGLTAVADALGDAEPARPAASGPDGRRSRPRTQERDPDRADQNGHGDGAPETDEQVEGRTEVEVPAEEPAARTATGEEAPRQHADRPAEPRRQQPKPEKRGRKGRGRASVPSWDEIMFGQPKG